MNRVELVGGLTREPEVRFTPNGAVVWNATIAVNGTRYDREAGGQVPKTTYVSLSAIGWMAESLTEQNYEKGDEIHVIGELDQFEITKDDGKKDRKTRVTPLVVTATRKRMKSQQASPWSNEPPRDAWSSDGPPPF